jgi:hypothetical protein
MFKQMFKHKEGNRGAIRRKMSALGGGEGQLKDLPICDLCEYAKLDGRCTLEPDPGVCKAHMPRYYFNQTEGICKEFIWGGCGGNVPFETLEECQTACENWIESCSKISICGSDDDCEYIWYTGGCYNPDYVVPCYEYQKSQGILPSEAPRRENVTCSCENNECITHG